MSAHPSWGRVPALERLGTCPPAPHLPWHSASPQGGGTRRGWGVPPLPPAGSAAPAPPLPPPAVSAASAWKAAAWHHPASAPSCRRLRGVHRGWGRGGGRTRAGAPITVAWPGTPRDHRCLLELSMGGLGPLSLHPPFLLSLPLLRDPQRHCSIPGKEKSRRNLSTHPVTPTLGTQRREHINRQTTGDGGRVGLVAEPLLASSQQHLPWEPGRRLPVPRGGRGGGSHSQQPELVPENRPQILLQVEGHLAGASCLPRGRDVGRPRWRQHNTVARGSRRLPQLPGIFPAWLRASPVMAWCWARGLR